MPISVDEDIDAVMPFVRELGLDVAVFVDTQGSAREAFLVTEIPTTVVIGANGRTRLRYDGWQLDAPQRVAAWIDSKAR